MIVEEQNGRMYIEVQTPERNFEGILHFVVYDDDLQLIAASYMHYDSVVKGLSAAIIEKRRISIGQTILNPLPGAAYRRKEKPIGMGDIHHGMVFPRHSVWQNILEDEIEKINFNPYIFVTDEDKNDTIGLFLEKKFNLPSCWREDYCSFLQEEHLEELTVVHNPEFPVWANLKVFRLKITKAQMLAILEEKLKNNELTIPPVDSSVQGTFSPGNSFRELIVNNAIPLANKLSETKPYYDPDTMPLHWAFRKMKRTPFPIQAYKIQGLTNAMLDSQSSVFDSGDMGTGKSISVCGITLLWHEIKKERGKQTGTSVLLSAPSITIPKWKDGEILPTLPDAKVTIINSTEDAIKLLNKVRSGHKPKKGDIEFYLIGLDRAKLGHDPHFSGIWKRVKNTHGSQLEYGWHCPECYERILINVEKDLWEPASYFDIVEKGDVPTLDDLESAKEKGSLTNLFLTGHKTYREGVMTANGIPDGFVKKWNVSSAPKTCHHCEAKLWRPSLKSRHETRNKPRYNASRILKKTNKWFDFFICDEVQQTKAEDSGRGDAFAQMVKAAKKGIFATGTLTTGKSTSIKEILWRSEPQALLDEGFDHSTGMVQWVKRYGVLKEIFEVEGGDKGVSTRRYKRAVQPKEEAGIAPQLVTNHILHKSAFTELGDLGLPLVELQEIPEIIKMESEHAWAYQRFHQTLFDECKKTHSFGKFIPATINYGDRPDIPAVVRFKDKDSGAEYEITAPSLPGRHAKLNRLIEIVKSELAEDRGVIIFNRYTDGYGMNQYIQDHLAQEGISSEILSSSTSTLQRFEWLQKQAEKGTKVLICNLSLVEVGLDLMAWSSIIYYQLDYDINKVRQSSRRHWRIGQHRECRTYYLVYENSQQMAQFENIMAKRGHAMLVEGRIDQSELAEFCKDTNNAMASDIANTLSGTEIAERWKRLAAKDIDEKLEIVAESDFKNVLKNRMKELADITLSKCLPIPEKKETSKTVDLKTVFLSWVSTFRLKTELEQNAEAIVAAIQNNQIPGFEWNGTHLYFDEVGTFGFSFVDETAVFDHILAHIKPMVEEKPAEVFIDSSNVVSLEHKRNQLNFEDILEEWHLVEVKEQTKKKRGKKTYSGQLALDIFDL